MCRTVKETNKKKGKQDVTMRSDSMARKIMRIMIFDILTIGNSGAVVWYILTGRMLPQ